ncbi:MAG: formyltransferase family protein [Candidatus Endonucleobacter bathymodioli]|uniref:Formyltransferase family protein n=1 Tax=Candidatus Endonucleibacter bathymodioli TaxID=539814 RepID=A0AA90NMJ5_9GAMM|nr:formyltransferase family protein [Candidatus Endonucleobacter bathymodioli]
MKQNIIIITMGLSRVVKPITAAHNVVGIIECSSRKNQQSNNKLLFKATEKIYSFIKKEIQTLKSFALTENIPYYFMDNGSDQALEKWAKDINPDVIVVYSMSQLLKKNIFNIPKYGTINLHPALLPSYRGPFPDFWMYYNCEKEGGVTIHYIDEGEDTGDIIYQEKYPIPVGMKSPDMLNLAVGKIGTSLLLKALDNIGNLPKQKQLQQSPILRARNIRQDEHKNIIDWDEWDIERIWHILRGTESWLNALEQPNGLCTGQRWTIENYENCRMDSNYQVSKIYTSYGKKFVACQGGKIFVSINFSLKTLIISLLNMR